jgi:4-hydroxybenzoate polyprenyltransferase
VSLLTNIKTTLEMIKWEHSIFALPFALCAAMLAAGGMPTAAKLGWIVLCMISARSAAMAFNRIADARIDAANPRTAMRAIPAGTLSQKFATAFVVVACLLFIFGAAKLNRVTLLLSPVALAVVLIYSYTKRFTRWSHLVLGFALGIAPAAGGFDVLYACQDIEFDRANSLNSIPQAMGVPKALIVARTLHVVMLGLLIALVVVFGLGKLAIVGVVVVAALLAYEHSLVASNDLSKLNAAFFTMNGVIAVVFFVFVAADLLMRVPKP